MAGYKTYTETQLTAPGSTTARGIQPFQDICYQYKVASSNTSVTVRVEGSNDNTNWFNMDDSETDTTQTADGTYELRATARANLYVRFTFVSEAGGTDATIDCVLTLSNPA